MIIRVLMENTSDDPDYIAEHGLSLYIETSGHRILFDTGQTDSFAVNAQKMGIDLSQVDIAIISHGHYDHGGGLKKFLSLNENAKIYINCHAFENHGNAAGKYIGLDRELAKNLRIVFTDEKYRIAEGINLFSCNERKINYPIDTAGLTVQLGEKKYPEDFRHEQYLLVEENEKKILISGCSHKGVLNIEEWFQPDVFIGGFHFMKLNIENEGKKILDDAAQRLLRYKTSYYTCHCTGIVQYQYLKEKMEDRLQYISCGQKIKI